jgi:uncharacterized paraquat-inducible protein A
MNRSKYIPIFETIGGVVVPLVLAGPWVLMGLGEGIHLFHEAAKMPFPEMARHDALVFLLYPVGGVLGLVSILLLMLCKGILRRYRFAFSLVTAGIVAGTCAAVKFLLDIGIMEIKHPDYGHRVIDWRPIVVFSLVLVPPLSVAWRRVAELWSPIRSEKRAEGALE